MPYNARLKLYVQVGSVQKFRTAAIKARDNADDSFTYGNITFYLGDRGSVFAELDLHAQIPRIIGKAGVKIKQCVISASYPAAKTSACTGSYGGRCSAINVQGFVTKDAETVRIKVSGMPLDGVMRFFDQIVAGEALPNRM